MFHVTFRGRQRIDRITDIDRPGSDTINSSNAPAIFAITKDRRKRLDEKMGAQQANSFNRTT